MAELEEFPEDEFDEIERKRLRRMLQDDANARWFKGAVGIYLKWLLALVPALWGAYMTFVTYLGSRPR